MQNLTEHIDSIETKVKMVLQKIEELKAENNVLKSKNDRLLNELDELKQNQETKEIVSPPAQITLGRTEEIKKELDHYIEEIDQTIELLKVS